MGDSADSAFDWASLGLFGLKTLATTLLGAEQNRRERKRAFSREYDTMKAKVGEEGQVLRSNVLSGAAASGILPGAGLSQVSMANKIAQNKLAIKSSENFIETQSWWNQLFNPSNRQDERDKMHKLRVENVKLGGTYY